MPAGLSAFPLPPKSISRNNQAPSCKEPPSSFFAVFLNRFSSQQTAPPTVSSGTPHPSTYHGHGGRRAMANESSQAKRAHECWSNMISLRMPHTPCTPYMSAPRTHKSTTANMRAQPIFLLRDSSALRPRMLRNADLRRNWRGPLLQSKPQTRARGVTQRITLHPPLLRLPASWPGCAPASLRDQPTST